MKTTVKFFFDRDSVIDQIGKKNARLLNNAGRMVRQEERKLIKPPKRATQKTIDQLSDAQRQRYHIAASVAKKEGRPKPKLPRLSYSAAEGAPPVSQTDQLKDKIAYAFDSSSQSMVIGPTKLPGSRANLRSLEESGPTINHDKQTVTIKAHPFGKPALANRQSAINKLFKDAL